MNAMKYVGALVLGATAIIMIAVLAACGTPQANKDCVSGFSYNNRCLSIAEAQAASLAVTQPANLAVPQQPANLAVPQQPANLAVPQQPAHPGPTTADAKSALRLDVQRLDLESAGFVWRGAPATATMSCPEGWMCTVTHPNGIVRLYKGNGQTVQTMAVTARYIAGYPPSDAVHAPCALLAKEQAFGKIEVPTFNVEGFECSVNPASQEPSKQPACPNFGGQSTSALAEGGCKFKSTTVVTAVVPSSWRASYWDGQTQKVMEAPSGVTITTAEATFYAN